VIVLGEIVVEGSANFTANPRLDEITSLHGALRLDRWSSRSGRSTCRVIHTLKRLRQY
jgi:hypothetical protein|tara:strand:- start:757 stop:930 length:174 start_codon:yes stop_codon:yes gene_type:complete